MGETALEVQIANLRSEVREQIGMVQVQIASLQVSVESDDRQKSQAIDFARELLTRQNDDIKALTAAIENHRVLTDGAISRVRVNLEEQIAAVDKRVDQQEATLNRYRGALFVLGVFVPILTAVLTAFVLKGMGLQ